MCSLLSTKIGAAICRSNWEKSLPKERRSQAFTFLMEEMINLFLNEYGRHTFNSLCKRQMRAIIILAAIVTILHCSLARAGSATSPLICSFPSPSPPALIISFPSHCPNSDSRIRKKNPVPVLSQLDQELPQVHTIRAPSVGLTNARSYSPATKETRERQSTTSTKFTVDIENSPSSGYDTAVRYCASLAEARWKSPQTVRVKVIFSLFQDINGQSDSQILGTGRPSRNWLFKFEGSSTIQMPMALAKAVDNNDLNAKLSGDDNYDVLIELNSRVGWYLGTDAKTDDFKFDLATVCLHEIFHGLLVSGNNIFIDYDPSVESYRARYLQPNKVGRFDQFMANQQNCNIVGYKFNETELGSALTSNNLFFVDAFQKRIAKLHAPRPFVLGSSLYHLSESMYGRPGDANDLMTPIINMGYSQHNIGDVMITMLETMMDMKNQPAAFVCENIGPPFEEEDPVTQYSGGDILNDKNDLDFNPGSFSVVIGGKTIDGWVLIGSCVGTVVLLVAMVALLQLCGCCESKPKRPKRRTRREDAVARREGGNISGLV